MVGSRLQRHHHMFGAASQINAVWGDYIDENLKAVSQMEVVKYLNHIVRVRLVSYIVMLSSGMWHSYANLLMERNAFVVKLIQPIALRSKIGYFFPLINSSHLSIVSWWQSSLRWYYMLVTINAVLVLTRIAYSCVALSITFSDWILVTSLYTRWIGCQWRCQFRY